MLLTEDKLVNWIESKNGLLITRSKCNEKQYNFDNINSPQYACITGYSFIINHFFTHLIRFFRKGVVLIIIESDIIRLSKNMLDHINLIHCFTWNKPFQHSKLSSLPIGLNYNRQYKVMEKWLENKPKIDHKKMLCMNCSLQTDPTRKQLQEHAITHWHTFCDFLDFVAPSFYYVIPSFIEGQIGIQVTNSKCYDLWNNYCFVLSPRGAGLDCHRTWEALAIGVIPIMLSSSIDDLFYDLPVLIVESWSMINKEFLQTQYEKIHKKILENQYNMEKLTLNYWTKIIQKSLKITRPKIHFITYGNKLFEESKKRLLKEAQNFNEFDTITAYGPEDIIENIHLDGYSKDFHNVFGMKRGGGYWVWRHIIINKTIENMENNDFLVYLDAGSTLNNNGKIRFYEYLQLLHSSSTGILSFQMHDHLEKYWTTKEIFDVMKEDINGTHANSGQLLGGILVMQKNPQLLEYMKRYSSIIKQHPLLVTDMFNEKQTHDGFQENRHEQSITSILRKQMNTLIINRDESWKPPFGQGESLKYPFWATRFRK
jgi:hypothetical protein